MSENISSTCQDRSEGQGHRASGYHPATDRRHPARPFRRPNPPSGFGFFQHENQHPAFEFGAAARGLIPTPKAGNLRFDRGRDPGFQLGQVRHSGPEIVEVAKGERTQIIETPGHQEQPGVQAALNRRQRRGAFGAFIVKYPQNVVERALIGGFADIGPPGRSKRASSARAVSMDGIGT